LDPPSDPEKSPSSTDGGHFQGHEGDTFVLLEIDWKWLWFSLCFAGNPLEMALIFHINTSPATQEFDMIYVNSNEH